MALQEIMAREQELLLEEFTRFVGLLDNRTDLTVQHAKAWTMDKLMDTIHPVSLIPALTTLVCHLPFTCIKLCCSPHASCLSV